MTTHTGTYRAWLGNSQNKLEVYDVPMTKHHWASHKKATVDFIDDAPFALDRQLEDQRFMMKNNRNPRLEEATRAEKSRSEKLLIKKGATRHVAMKAKVLNKIVRQESGQHTYTLVPPVVRPGTHEVEEPVDPETHPLFRPYAVEAHQKPVVRSFGHRPSSASRTFNPATMKVRLRHGSVARQEKPAHATGFGIPVAVLTKVLKAPALPRPGDVDDTLLAPSTAPGPLSDTHGLFPSEEEMAGLGIRRNHSAAAALPTVTGRTAPTDPHAHRSISPFGSPGSPESRQTAVASTVTGRSRSRAGKAPPGHGKENTRPEWEQSFFKIDVKASDVYKLKQSGINVKGNFTIAERLNRFAKVSVAEAQITPWCSEKQVNDKRVVQTGRPIPAKRPDGFYGESWAPYEDPTSGHIARLKEEREADEQRRDAARRRKHFTERAKDIPDVPYNPMTALQRMRSAQGAQLFEHAVETGSAAAYLSDDFGRKHEAEKEFVAALQAARRGDRRALLDYYMFKGAEDAEGGATASDVAYGGTDGYAVVPTAAAAGLEGAGGLGHGSPGMMPLMRYDGSTDSGPQWHDSSTSLLAADSAVDT